MKTETIKQKNTCLKMREVEEPYEVWKTADGSWEWRVLKKWQVDDNKEYARWFCAVKSPFTFGRFEFGDVYVSSIKKDAQKVSPLLISCDHEVKALIENVEQKNKMETQKDLTKQNQQLFEKLAFLGGVNPTNASFNVLVENLFGRELEKIQEEQEWNELNGGNQ